MEQGKSLSKNLVYTPLEAYIQYDNASAKSAVTAAVDHPSQYMNQQSSVPKSLHESSLASFLQSVSHDYHRHQATPRDAKNNASRPLTIKDVDNRIKQRAVTLIGGGINASLPITTSQHKRTKNKKRRRQAPWDQVQEQCQQWSTRNERTLGDGEILREMNSAWNKYIWNLMDIASNDDGSNAFNDDSMAIKRVQQLLSTNDGNIELVGAHVKIVSCESHRAWAGRRGVLVGESANTYRIAGLEFSWSRRDPNHSKKGYANDILTLVVPKKATSLMLFLPMTDNDARQAEDAELIRISERTIGVTWIP